MRWVIEVACEPDADQLVMVQGTIETAADFLLEALDDLKVPKPGVSASLQE